MSTGSNEALKSQLEDALRRIAELEEAAFYSKSVVESANEAIVTKTLDGIVTSWNKSAERLFGYTAAEMIGQPVSILVPSDQPDEEPHILERLRRGERIEHYETRRQRKDGPLVDVVLTVSPIIDKSGKIIGASKIARDISERKQLEERERKALEEAHQARVQAEEANRLKDEFLATVSHELRTPLTAVLGWLGILRSSKPDEATLRQALDVIDRNTKSQAQLIEDLLDISRIITGKLRFEVRPIDPSAVIAAAVEALRVAADAKQIRIQTVLDSGAGPVSGDFERLQQVVWNLLSNAIKFTPKRGRIHIALERVNSHIEIRVTDSGEGISAEFLPYVFDRFSQADRQITRSRGGLGMGLAIAKSIVELHGGTISAASEGKDRGATFTVKLPLMPVQHEVPEQRVHPRASTYDVPMECPTELMNLRMLVVDDEADTCEMLRALFQHCGAVVETALTAEAALLQFESGKPDVVIADIGMPVMDGYTLIRLIREREEKQGRKTPAIALTAFARIEDRVKALDAGYQMHVAKPVQPGELLTVVASLMRFTPRA